MDSQAIWETKVCMVRRVSKAVTKTRPALEPAKRSLSSLRRLPSTMALRERSSVIPVSLDSCAQGNLPFRGGSILHLRYSAISWPPAAHRIPERMRGCPSVRWRSSGKCGGSAILTGG